MLTTLRKFTLIFLAIVQLIAPLVHAHVGENAGVLPNPGLGMLHVPGLERYSISHQPSQHCMAVVDDFTVYGMLVGIDTGIKDKHLIIHADNDCYLNQLTAQYKSLLSSIAIINPLETQQFSKIEIIPSSAPRAPPAL